MMTFTARRWLAGVVTGAATLAVGVFLLSRFLALRDTSDVSGWGLLGMTLFLVLYNLRKKLTYPPLLRSSTWLQLHVYVGLLSVILLLFHTGLQLPNGLFEVTLAALYIGVAGSGVVGLLLSRAVPSRLTVSGDEILYERIPMFRRELRERAEGLVLKTVEATDYTTLPDFYARRLIGFFGRPRYRWLSFPWSRRHCRQLLHELRSLERHCNDEERRAASELAEHIESRDVLDYHEFLQGLLKGWLFVHIPLTYIMLLFIAVHIVLVHAFFGGMR